jgi:hypothetical protein
LNLLIVFYGIVALSILLAALFGGRAERAGALVLAAMVIIQTVPMPVAPSRFHQLDPVACVDDLFGFVAFTWIGLKARRYWPLCAAALQLLALASHFIRLWMVEDSWAYALSKSVPTLVVCFCLMWGTAAFARRKRRKRRGGSAADLAGPPGNSSPRT